MTQSSTRTMPARPGDSGVAGEKRSSGLSRRRTSQAARRRWLILFAVIVVVVVAFLVNLGPLTHYQDASGRLQKATAKVDALEAQKADLQGQLAKLSEAGYLETLAREQLTYVRPGEELYIVTKPAGDLGSAAAAAGAAPAAGGTSVTLSAAAASAAQPPGFFERALSAIRGLF